MNKLKKILSWCRINLKYGLALAILGAAIFYGALYAATFKAAEIFNYVVQRQQVLQGSLTVERLAAHISGRVEFTNLIWKDPDGELIAQVPSGEFRIKLWEVVCRNFTTESLTYLTVKDAFVRLEFDEDMSLVNVDRSLSGSEAQRLKAARAQAARELRRRLQREAMARAQEMAPKDAQSVANGRDKVGRIIKTDEELSAEKLKRSQERWRRMATSEIVKGKKFKGEMHFENCSVEMLFGLRNMVMDGVEANLEIDTDKRCKIDFNAPSFTGTVQADGLTLSGYIDFTTRIPEYHLGVLISNCNPATLGMGGDLKDAVTLDASVGGILPEPEVDGIVSLRELKLPNLYFSNVRALAHYEDGVIRARNMTGSVFGGSIEGGGWYNIDRQSYSIDILGHDLNGGIAAHDMKLNCEVELELHMRSSGDVKRTVTFGEFKTGKGSYLFIPFESISGRFNNIYKKLSFEDVYITTSAGNIKTDALRIENGKVKLGQILLERPDKGDTIRVN